MLNKLSSSVKSAFRSFDVRIVVFLVMLVLFILGAGAPGAVGI